MMDQHPLPDATLNERRAYAAARAAGLGPLRCEAADLPGKVDIVCDHRKITIFANGCFWHNHEGCHLASMPKTQKLFWQRHFAVNKQRDERVAQELVDRGWRVIWIWECSTRNSSAETIASAIHDGLALECDHFEIQLERSATV
jgi:DNA mismatch endonuclease (patch repair protein)